MSETLFITLTPIDSERTITINVDHIIDIEDRTERTFSSWIETKKTWFGLGPDKTVERSAYNAFKKIDGAKITTTQRRQIQTRCYGAGSGHGQTYRSGGGNIIIEVKEERLQILDMIKKGVRV